MMSTVRSWLNTLPLSDPLQQRQARVFQAGLIVWIAIASIAVPILMLIPKPTATESPSAPQNFSQIVDLLSFASSLLWITPVIAFVLLRRGRFAGSVSTALCGFLVSHSIATFLMGITSATVLVMFQIPIVLAGLLSGRRVLLTVSGYSIALVALVAVLQNMSPPRAAFLSMLASAPGIDTGGPTTAIMLGFFAAVTILLTILLDQFGGALRNALNTSLERESELRDIRAALETTVTERTAALRTALSDVQAKAQEQAQLVAELSQQRELIKELSVPVIPVDAGTLVMPLVGALDTARIQELQAQCLQALERTSAHTLLLDITGVPVVDTQVAQGILMTVQAGRLLGAEIGLVGIRPEVAQTIVGLGIRLQDVRTFSSLQSALMQSGTQPSRSV